ncbi:hypothetical protein [Microbacterium sp. zg-YB36]|uniref:hypothetical protein n=1 Tax=Microbacterium sp. zg-YB36 TaxID=2969407 RepID=UPI00214C3F43|nr:hypothetical protein [Microbacterium sp. zg-YB36]MDL5350522.1 hypothetical protein [Microbacterium sp. zg-YB36]
MTSDDNMQARPADDDDRVGMSASDAVEKDMTYSPSSEEETRRKQEDPLPDTLDDDIDTENINVTPGTGGPDDAGDVEVDPADLNMPGRPAED